MGGTQALVVAGLHGEREPRLAGVIAFIPAADLVDVACHSSCGEVRDTLAASVAGNLQKLEERSPAALLEKYPAGLPFVIAYNEADTILPVRVTADLPAHLAARGLPVVAWTIPGEHSFVARHLDENIDYRRLMADLGKSRPAARLIPTR
jgi:hypothetical protein